MKRIKIFGAGAALLLALSGCGVAASAAPSTQPQVWGATKTCTTSTSGSCTITHGLGVVPSGITANLVNRSGMVRIQSKTSNTVTILAAKSVSSNNTVTPWASTSITVELVAAYTPSLATTPPTTSPTTPPTTSPTTQPTTPPTTPATTPPTVEPTTSAPSQDRACPAFPAFPDASCTGVIPGTVLKNCNGMVQQDNVVLEGCLFTGGVTIEARNVTIKNSKIKGMVAADYILNWDLSGLKLIDVEIDGTGYVTANGESAIGYNNYSCLRCNIHGSGRGFNFANGVTITDSWAHDFTYVDGAHQSAAGSNGGSNNVVTHNRLDCGSQGCSGALVMYGDFDPVDNNVIKNNLFDGGSYCLYGGSTGESSGKKYPHGTNIKILDNRFGKKYPSEGGPSRCGWYGPVAAWENNAGNVWSGNAWEDGSGSVNP